MIRAEEILGEVRPPVWRGITRVVNKMPVAGRHTTLKAPPIPRPAKVAKATKSAAPSKPKAPPLTRSERLMQGRALARAREALGLSQAAAAARLFIAPSTLGCYEAGHKAVPAFRYDSLAAALGMPANWYRVKP